MYNGKIRIALVEDSNCDLVLIKKVLENGFNEAEIHVFSTIESFKENWDSNETDIIISDHQIVDSTSFDLIKYLVDEGFTTPIIILSGALSDTDIAKLIIDYKVNDIILKKDLHRLNQTVLKEIQVARSRIELAKQSEELNRLSLVAKHTHNGVIITDVHENTVWVNEAYCKISGYTIEETIGKKPGKLLQGSNTSTETTNRIHDKLKTKKPFSEEILNYHKNGNEYWIKLDITPIYEDGQHKGFVAIQEEISDRKNAEEQLQSSEALFRSLTENLPGVVFRYRFGRKNPGKIEYISDHCKELYELTQDEIVNDNKKLWDLINPEDLENMVSSKADSIENFTHWSFEYRIKTPSGVDKWIRASGTPSSKNENDEVIWDSIAIDITKEKVYSNALLDSNNRLLKAQKAGKIGDWHYNFNTGEIFWSDEMYNIYDRNPSDEIPSFEELIHERTIGDSSILIQKMEECFVHGEPYSITYRFESYKGIIKDHHATVIPEKNDKGEVVAFHGTSQDVTVRMDAIRKIQESEDRLDAAIKGADLGVWDLDIESGRNLVNTRWYSMLGYEPFDFEANFQSFLSLLHPDDKILILDATDKLNNGESEFDIIIRLRHKDGSFRTIRDQGRVVERQENGEIKRLIGTNLDITNETKLRDELTQSLHDKTILLQEIHHRVKNNLAVIIGLLHLQSFNSKNDELGVFYDEMSNRIKSIADVHELLYSSETLSKINLKSYIGKLFNNVLSLSKSDVELNPLIFIDENFEMNINQAIPLGLLVNELLTNSVKHAFKGIDNPTISFTVIKEEESISISYKDNGVGFEIEGHSSPTSLGFTLINTLLGQLEANYSFTNSIGFGIEFSIPLVKQGSHSYLSN